MLSVPGVITKAKLTALPAVNAAGEEREMVFSIGANSELAPPVIEKSSVENDSECVVGPEKPATEYPTVPFR
jgi:hypothetical protein